MQTLKEYYSDSETIRRLTDRFRNMTLSELRNAGKAKKLGLSFMDTFLTDVGYIPELGEAESLTFKEIARLLSDSSTDPRFSNPEGSPPFTSEENLMYIENLLCRYLNNVYDENYAIKRFLLIPVKRFFKTMCGRANSKAESDVLYFYMKPEKQITVRPEEITILDILKESNSEMNKSWIPTCWSLADYSARIMRTCKIFGIIFVDLLADKNAVQTPDAFEEVVVW